MTTPCPRDPSNGYELAAGEFIAIRDSGIGVATVREWSKTLAAGSSVLDLGCGHGVPISQLLIEGGFALYGIDASRKMIAAFRERFPDASTEWAAVEDSLFFNRTFDAALAWGLMFLLPAETQALLIRKVAKALNPAGKFLFTSPREEVSWTDALTGRESRSLGSDAYREMLFAEGLAVVGEAFDEGENYYYLSERTTEQPAYQRCFRSP